MPVLPPENPKEILKIAVVGAGYRSEAHLSSLAKLTDLYRLVAVCDTFAERAQEAAQRCGVSAYTDLESMLKAQRPDVVLITVPPEAHHPVAELAASYKAHLLCETPISVTRGYAQRMVRAAAENGVKLEVTENVWRWPHERFKRMLVDAGMIGEVQTARLWYTSGSYHGVNAIRTLIGGNARRVVGMAKVLDAPLARRGCDPNLFRIFAPAGAQLPRRFTESTKATWEAGLIEFDTGAVALYEFPILSRPRGNWWEIMGDNGYISGFDVMSGGESFRIVPESEEKNGRKVLTRVRLMAGDKPASDLVWENPFLRYAPEDADDVARIDQLVGIYRAATEGIEPEYGAASAIKDIEILIAVRESALRGNRPVELPLGEETEYERRVASFYNR